MSLKEVFKIAIINWVKETFFHKEKQDNGTVSINLSDSFCLGLTKEIYIKNLAIKTAINLIVNGLSQSEFLTFNKGKEIKGENYYLFNVEANQNQNASDFWRSVIKKMIYNNEALVIQVNGNFYVCEDYSINEYAFLENLYKDIQVSNYNMKVSFVEGEVFRFRLNDDNIRNVIEGVYSDYGKLIEYSKEMYKTNNVQRGILNIPTSYPQTTEAQAKLEDLMYNKMKRFFETDKAAVFPLSNGITYQDLSNQTYKNATDSRDIKNLIDDVFDFVAIGFQIPPQLLKGTINEAENVIDRYIVFRVNPIAEVITDEINRKLYGKESFLENTYLKIDTSKIKIISLKEMATAVDILFRTGTNTINDNLKMMGKETVDDEIANKRFITKNYSGIESLDKEEQVE